MVTGKTGAHGRGRARWVRCVLGPTLPRSRRSTNSVVGSGSGSRSSTTCSGVWDDPTVTEMTAGDLIDLVDLVAQQDW